MAAHAVCGFLLLLCALLISQTLSESPVVSLKKGVLRGYTIQRNNLTIYAFEGIPYATPPVGERRFKDPEEHEGWSGERNATAYGSICMQLDGDNVIGDEDCLFLNVYTMIPPHKWESAKLPVLVWINGGAYQRRSGNMDENMPDLLLEKGLVFVSINYRLNVLGFLSSEDSEAPGNAGLKDAVLALKWVKENIGAFGGDCDRVTISGESAGGSAVHYLTISPMAKGLFRGAIVMSGTAITSNMIMEEPRPTAERLRDRVECEEGLDLIPCLQSVDAKLLVSYSMGQLDPNKVVLDYCRDAFLPSIEAPGSTDTPFLPMAPEILMVEGPVEPVPLLIGSTDAEGILFLKTGGGFLDDPSRWQTLDDGFVEALQQDLPYGLRTEENVLRMREYYIGDHQLAEAPTNNDTLYGFLRMSTDVYFGVGTVRAAEAAARRGAPVYLYEFCYDSPIMASLKRGFYNASHVAGVAHADDLSFIFATDIQPSPIDSDVRDRMVTMFGNFVKTGNPTPEGSSSPLWPQYDPDEEKYAEIGEEFIVRDTPLQGRMPFWRELESSARKRRAAADDLVVRVEHGWLRGRWTPSLAGGSYASFLGVPYAKPPLGPLRFKDPEDPEPWEGIRDALQHGSTCFQAELYPFSIHGGEDCLFVNVYTPDLHPKEKLNVMVWIHGGGFIGGSGDNDVFGPDFLVAEDLIVVTFNYRLGPFGFLYLNEAAPGNVGLKDQVAALRWVQKNIEGFGGDPDKVTIFGESAGSASVHLLMLSPLSAGLFQKAIAESSAAISPWATQTAPADTARRLAQAVGCESADDRTTVDCLREADAEDIMQQAFTSAPTPIDQGRIIGFVFVPTVDFPNPTAFLPAPAIDLIAEGRQHQVPLLIGLNNNESILALTAKNFFEEEVAHELDTTWDTWLLPELRLPANSSRNGEALDALREFYMSGRPLTNETIPGFMDMYSDVTFGEGIYYTIRHMLQNHNASVYEYLFTVDDELNALKTQMPVSVAGAAHADELGYLFAVSYLPVVSQNSTAAKIRSRMVRAWTNFAKYGDPTPTDDPLLGVRWQPRTAENAYYLEIGQELSLRSNLYGNRDNFFEEFYRTYG